jgi:hypothetical protein
MRRFSHRKLEPVMPTHFIPALAQNLKITPIMAPIEANADLALTRKLDAAAWPLIQRQSSSNRKATSAVDLKFLQFVCTHVKELQIQKPH